MLTCVECGGPVTEDKAWHQVIGWEHRRDQGGTNHVALRKQTGKLMCGVCMAKQQEGVHALQGSML